MSNHRNTLIQLGLELQTAYEQQFSSSLWDWTDLTFLSLDDVVGWHQLHDDVVKWSSLQKDWTTFISRFNQGLYPEILDNKQVQHRNNESQKFVLKEKKDLEAVLEKKNKPLKSLNLKKKPNTKQEFKAQNVSPLPKAISNKVPSKTMVSKSLPFGDTQKLVEKSNLFDTKDSPKNLKDLSKLLHKKQLSKQEQTEDNFLKKETKSAKKKMPLVSIKKSENVTTNVIKKTEEKTVKIEYQASHSKDLKALSQWLNTKNKHSKPPHQAVQTNKPSVEEEKTNMAAPSKKQKLSSSLNSTNSEDNTSIKKLYLDKQVSQTEEKNQKDVKSITPENIAMKSDMNPIDQHKTQLEAEDIEDIIEALSKHIQQEYKRFYG